MEQFIALRRHYYPHDNDEIDSLARAAWLNNQHWENMRIAVANGIALALKGDK
ncbi:hypothetical protein AB6F62_04910 [Providencia huaxiensis]|uniref:DUF6890 family protein n=1 Tax=Providencia TaxID=586 RepID=UPI001313F0E6|nr:MULTISPECIES: hypothetical protein [Providencia]MBP6079765.1 hypothetical protein [Providencia sp.]EJD6400476.1 hypothetical protein [Providencia rettgeri]EJF7712210.1 hypothetical protein [Providencia rettgeri]ELR5129172.1 hypothetical protein [Providencia rettgeri]ELR5145387.1 hypothetical protein [Providencia rettgeri]